MPMHKLLIYSFIYFSITYALFAVTTGGWQAVLFVYLGLYFWGSIFLIFSIALLIRWILTGKKIVSINTDWLKLIIFIQIIAIFFNHGDCGDDGGSYFFFQTLFDNIFATKDLCKQEASAFIYTIWYISFLSYLTLMLLNLVMMIIQTRDSSNETTIPLIQSKHE